MSKNTLLILGLGVIAFLMLRRKEGPTDTAYIPSIGFGYDPITGAPTSAYQPAVGIDNLVQVFVPGGYLYVPGAEYDPSITYTRAGLYGGTFVPF